jgi:nicotinamidase-related amidase
MVLSEQSIDHLQPEQCALLIIDIQERLMPVITNNDRVAQRSAIMIKAAQELGMPVLATTQNVARIGLLVEPVQEALGVIEPVDKMEFDCFRNADVLEAFRQISRQVNTVIVCGVETHICIYQSVVGGLQCGYRMWVVGDAVSSRTLENREIGLERIRQIGGLVGNSEMVIYDLLGKAGTPSFRALLPLLK